MKVWRILLASLVIAGLTMPDAAIAAGGWRAQNPCGKIICCCPKACHRAKQNARACPLPADDRCGLRTASSRDNAISSHEQPAPVYKIVSLTLQDVDSSSARIPSNAFLLLPDSHGPLLIKPPSQLA